MKSFLMIHYLHYFSSSLQLFFYSYSYTCFVILSFFSCVHICSFQQRDHSCIRTSESNFILVFFSIELLWKLHCIFSGLLNSFFFFFSFSITSFEQLQTKFDRDTLTFVTWKWK